MMHFPTLIRSTGGAAAAEMALILPLLLIIMMGSMELGNYFYNEHKLVKAVRDGARFAGRQNFSVTGCSAALDPTIVTSTQNVVMTGMMAGGTNRLANWDRSTITVAQSCAPATVDGQNMRGIYTGMTNAPIVTVSAAVPYVPILNSYGFTGAGLSLRADQQAAVMGL